jgi:hypothetical protein
VESALKKKKRERDERERGLFRKREGTSRRARGRGM